MAARKFKTTPPLCVLCIVLIAVQVEAFRRIYLGKVAYPESLERLLQQIEGLQGIPAHALFSIKYSKALLVKFQT